MVLDLAQFWENYAELIEIVPALIDKFKASYPVNMMKIKEALAADDPEALRVSAHGLKGMLLQLYAPASGTLATRLEALAKTKDLTGAPELFSQLEAEVALLEKELSQIAGNSLAA